MLAWKFTLINCIYFNIPLSGYLTPPPPPSLPDPSNNRAVRAPPQKKGASNPWGLELV